MGKPWKREMDNVPAFFVVATITAVRRQSDRVIEAQQPGYLVYQIDGVSLELVVAGELLWGILSHAVRGALWGTKNNGIFLIKIGFIAPPLSPYSPG